MSEALFEQVEALFTSRYKSHCHRLCITVFISYALCAIEMVIIKIADDIRSKKKTSREFVRSFL